MSICSLPVCVFGIEVLQSDLKKVLRPQGFSENEEENWHFDDLTDFYLSGLEQLVKDSKYDAYMSGDFITYTNVRYFVGLPPESVVEDTTSPKEISRNMRKFLRESKVPYSEDTKIKLYQETIRI